MEKEVLASHIDFADHNPYATEADIRKLCSNVLKYGFNSAFVNQSHVKLARKLVGRKAKVGTVVSFPLGQDSTKSKVFSAIDSVKNGADEIDISMNVGLFKENKKAALKEMVEVVEAAKKTKKGTIVKFIIETGYLNSKEIVEAAKLVVKSGADFVKCDSGYGPRGTSVNDVRIIRKAIGFNAFIKAAGGIHTTKQALDFLKAGADRMGTSHAIQIIEGIKVKKSLKKKSSRSSE